MQIMWETLGATPSKLKRAIFRTKETSKESPSSAGAVPDSPTSATSTTPRNDAVLILSDFHTEKILQEGRKSHVSVVKNSKGEKFVLKRINESASSSALYNNEVEAGKKLKHPNIVKFYDHFEERELSYILLEHIDGMDLFQFMEKRDFTPLPEKQLKKIFLQLAKTVEFCHKKGFVHRDLKLENAIITKKDQIKLIDFGFCKKVSCHELLETYLGSWEYASPQIIQRKPFNACKSEVWSLGVMLYALAFGQFPFSPTDREQEFIHEPRVPFPSTSGVSDACKDLLEQMLSCNPERRIDLKGVLKHPWLK